MNHVVQTRLSPWSWNSSKWLLLQRKYSIKYALLYRKKIKIQKTNNSPAFLMHTDTKIVNEVTGNRKHSMVHACFSSFLIVQQTAGTGDLNPLK